MREVKFSMRQPNVKYYESSDRYYIFICLNESEIDVIERNSNNIEETELSSVHYYVYDYEEIIEDKNKINIDDVQTNPENYLNYELVIYKKEKVNQSKELLQEYLLNHPITSTCHNGKEATYSITEEKQGLMVRALLIYQSKIEAGIEAELKWNSTGNEYENWTLDEFKQLMLEIDDAVTPLVFIQQQYEKNIMSCCTKDEVDAFILNYDNARN